VFCHADSLGRAPGGVLSRGEPRAGGGDHTIVVHLLLDFGQSGFGAIESEVDLL
jgi:hypothetical protein